jgi:phosphotransferase system HPr (HPr) family protein
MSARSEAAGTGRAEERAMVLPADLHARPAGQVTRTAAAYDAAVVLCVGADRTVDARSVLAVMGLGAVAGQIVTISATGAQAVEAVEAVAAVLAAAESVAG